MSSSSPCSRKVTLYGTKVDLDRYAVFSRAADGTLSRVRHRDDLSKDADYVVVLKTRDTDDIAASFDDPSLRPDVWRVPKPVSGRVLTHQGGPGYLRDYRSALILGTLGTWKGGDTFHESDASRSQRLRSLVQQATLSDPDWVRELIPFVRSEGNMRTVAIHAAIDAAAMGHPDAAELIAETIQRADEPGVALQYWLETYGRSMPSAVRKGLAQAATRLYSERNVMRYGSAGKNRVSATDVLRLTHPKPRDAKQETLFKFINARDKQTKDSLLGSLEMASAHRELLDMEKDERTALFESEVLAARSALTSGDKSFKSVFSRAGFSTAETSAWISSTIPDTIEMSRAKERHALLRSEHSTLMASRNEAKSALDSATKRARDSVMSSSLGADLLSAKERLSDAVEDLRSGRSLRKEASTSASSRPHWDRDADAVSVLSDARLREQEAYDAYKNAKMDYLRAKTAFYTTADEMIPGHLGRDLERAEDLLHDVSYRMRSSEQVLRQLQPGIPADVWQVMLPSMGYMELLRNVRNMESSGVPSEVLSLVCDRLADPDEIRASRQMPLRFWSAAKALSGSSTFETALERGVEVSTESVPSLPGRTLILVDQSGSMGMAYSGARDNGSMARDDSPTLGEVAALYGAALAKRSGNADLVMFGSEHHRVPGVSESSVLSTVREHGSANLGGTHTWSALRENYNEHDRIIVLSDGQSHDSGTLPPGVPVHFFDLTGHSVSFVNDNTPNYFAYGGLSDLSFRLFAFMEGQKGAASDLLKQDRSSTEDI